MARAERRWDVEEARRLRQEFLAKVAASGYGVNNWSLIGLAEEEVATYPALARRYGVSLETVRRALDPARHERFKRYNRAYMMRSTCPGCGGPKSRNKRVCQRCKDHHAGSARAAWTKKVELARERLRAENGDER